MKVTRGITLGFIVGAFLGLLIYLRLQEDKRRGRRGFLRMHIRTDKEEAPKPGTIEIQRRGAASEARRAADNLELIDGIGPVYAQRLAAAGVETFAALAQSTADALGAAVGGRVSQENLKSWISQAKKMK